MIIVIAGPSGVGKTTLCKLLVENLDNLAYSVSATTREKRETEKEGLDYYFLTEEEFKNWKLQGQFLEIARVHNYFYGTPKDSVMKPKKAGKDIVMDIDVQGKARICEKFDDVVTVFLLPPTMEEAIRRIKKRGLEKEGKIKNRVETASQELKEVENFDYLVVNEDLSATFEAVKSIIIAERHSIKRMEEKLCIH